MRKLIAAVCIYCFLFSAIAYGETLILDVPTYDQNYFGYGCAMDCSPTVAAMILGYYDAQV